MNAREVRELVENKITGQEMIHLGELVTRPKNERRKSFRERSEARYTTEEILKMEGRMLGSVGADGPEIGSRAEGYRRASD